MDIAKPTKNDRQSKNAMQKGLQLFERSRMGSSSRDALLTLISKATYYNQHDDTDPATDPVVQELIR